MRRLADECRRVLSPDVSIRLTFACECGCATVRSRSTFTGRLATENEWRRAIVETTLQAEKRGASIVCRFATEKEKVRESNTAKVRESSITVVGQDRQWVYATISRLEERLRNMKEWYPRGTGEVAGFFLVGLTSVVVVLLLQRRGVVFETIERDAASRLNQAGKLGLLCSLCALALGVIGGRLLFRPSSSELDTAKGEPTSARAFGPRLSGQSESASS